MDPKFMQIYSALSLSMVGYACGTVLAYPGVVLAQWEKPGSPVRLTNAQASWFACIVQLVSIPGSIISGPLTECVGPRRLTLILLPLLALTWTTLSFLVHSPILLILMRAIQGLLASILANTSYIYPCEISDVTTRGVLGSFIDTTYSLGFLATYILGGLVSWEYLGYVILSITTIPCFITVALVPESPMWLIRKGSLKKAIENLKKVRSRSDNVEEEAFLESSRLSQEINISMYQRIQLLTYPRYLLPVLAACILMILKESTGQFAVVLFVVQIFSKVKTGLSPYWCSVIMGICRCICNLGCCILLTKIPRRNMIGFSTIFAGISMVTIGVYFYFETLQNNTSFRWLPLACVLSFVISYALGIGPVSWLLAVELLPASVRNLGGGLGLASFNLTQWVIAGSFAEIQRSYGLHVSFWAFGTGCILLTFFVVFFLPETKGKTFAEIEDHWTQKEKNCNCFSKAVYRLGNANQNESMANKEDEECSPKLLEAVI